MEVSLYGLIMSKFDENGVWQGSSLRVIVVNGEAIQIDQWAAENGVTLPDAGE